MAAYLVFSGSREGYFFALDAHTGDEIWRVNLGGLIEVAATRSETTTCTHLQHNASKAVELLRLRHSLKIGAARTVQSVSRRARWRRVSAR